jgi:hypothetical protein
MTREQETPLNLDERTRQAIAELQGEIRRRYPTASFEVSRPPDDPDGIHLTAVVDVDDPDEVGDLVIDRVVELQAEEGIPIHVIPIRTPERVQASLQAASVHRSRRRALSLFGRVPKL